MPQPSIMFIAGEPSADLHTARVIENLSRSKPDIHTFGIGGPLMKAAGFEQLLPFEPFNRMGIVEVLFHLPFFLSAKNTLISVLHRRRPCCLVCVDYPGFNIPMMKAAHRMNIPVLWYIVPQVWAWKKKRAETLGKYASKIAVVFPFETDLFRPWSLPGSVSFVGHPLMEELDSGKQSFRGIIAEPRGKDDAFHLVLAPGSRIQEVERMAGPMLRAAGILKTRFPAMTISVSCCPGIPHRLYTRHSAPDNTVFHEGDFSELLLHADCALVTSGTATLQTALYGVPMVIAYKTSLPTYLIARYMVSIPCIGLPNIVAGEKVVPECIQGRVTGEILAREMEAILSSPQRYNEITHALSALREKLGSKKASEEVAGMIRELC